MKKNYNIPQTEVSVVKAMSLMTVSNNFSTGGGGAIPEQGI